MECQKSLLKPVPTRWNSLFDAIRRLLEFKDKLGIIFEIAEVQRLTAVEIEFLEDYVSAMKPVATALDKLQSETDYYFGFYAPTIYQTFRRLNGIITNSSGRRFTVPLAKALKQGVLTRFKEICELDLNTSASRHVILAAVTHPYFKLRWLPQSSHDDVKKLLLDEAKSKGIQNSSSALTTEIAIRVDEGDSFFEFDSPQLSQVSNGEEKSLTELECLQYLNEESTELQSLNKYSTIKKLFIYYNTPLPTSAPVERLFSYSGLVLGDRRGSLTDDNFEKLVFLKTNANSC